VRNIKTKIEILAFLLILVVTAVLHTQISHASSDNLQSQSGKPLDTSDNSDNSDTQNQEGTDTNTREGPETSDIVTNESDAAPDETSNASSIIPSAESITTAPSYLTPSNQSSNQTEEASKPTATIGRQLSPGLLSDLAIISPPPPHKVKVTFDSMAVHNDHEGALSGDGEYDIAVYVQGIKVGLTDASGPGDGLWDVSSGETVTFNPGTEVTVAIPSTLPLSVMTVGSEVDGCDRTAFPEDIQDGILRVLTLGGALRNIQDEINDGINWIGCKLNGNDVLGVINNVYEPTSYGAGSHEEKSDKGDFTLRYTIGVTAPPPPAPDTNKQTDLQPNKFSNQLDNDLTLERLNSSVQKKLDDTRAGVIGKIG
jgi:hypothetical protein